MSTAPELPHGAPVRRKSFYSGPRGEPAVYDVSGYLAEYEPGKVRIRRCLQRSGGGADIVAAKDRRGTDISKLGGNIIVVIATMGYNAVTKTGIVGVMEVIMT